MPRYCSHTCWASRASRLPSHPEAPCAAGQVREYLALIGRRAAGRAARLPDRTPRVLVAAAACLASGAGSAAGDRTPRRACACALPAPPARPAWPTLAPVQGQSRLPWRASGRCGSSWPPTCRMRHWPMARANAAALGLPGIEFRPGDWFAALAQEPFDLIVSNPPYIDATDAALALLQHEPRSPSRPEPMASPACALIAAGAVAHLRPAAGCCSSTARDQAAAVRDALVLAGFRHVTLPPRSRPDSSA